MVEIVRISACIYVVLEYSRIVFGYDNCDFGSAQTSIVGLEIDLVSAFHHIPNLGHHQTQRGRSILGLKVGLASDNGSLYKYEHSHRGLMAFLCHHVQCRLPKFVRGLGI